MKQIEFNHADVLEAVIRWIKEYNSSVWARFYEPDIIALEELLGILKYQLNNEEKQA